MKTTRRRARSLRTAAGWRREPPARRPASWRTATTSCRRHRDGLADGDLIVVAGQAGLKDGAKVRIVEGCGSSMPCAPPIRSQCAKTTPKRQTQGNEGSGADDSTLSSDSADDMPEAGLDRGVGPVERRARGERRVRSSRMPVRRSHLRSHETRGRRRSRRMPARRTQVTPASSARAQTPDQLQHLAAGGGT